uniref:Somatostatin/Cortistatin C-terminal domain-containing protein n=2 Tax=Gasterosteus aculeatus TaxID=69293 RepID=A0AAQ4Q7P0_GASAC
MAHILCVFALLCFAFCAAQDGETQRGFKDNRLQRDSLPWLDKLQDEQDSTKKLNLIEWLYSFYKFDNGNIVKGPTDAEEPEKNRRGLGKTTRRFGCRVFFWKSWSPC